MLLRSLTFLAEAHKQALQNHGEELISATSNTARPTMLVDNRDHSTSSANRRCEDRLVSCGICNVMVSEVEFVHVACSRCVYLLLGDGSRGGHSFVPQHALGCTFKPRFELGAPIDAKLTTLSTTPLELAGATTVLRERVGSTKR